MSEWQFAILFGLIFGLYFVNKDDDHESELDVYEESTKKQGWFSKVMIALGMGVVVYLISSI